MPTDNPHLAAAPRWRRDPYRVFFPLGALLAWAGVLHWFLHATGLLADYNPVVHAIVQIQGFMMCFAVGFLFTAIPRRTGTRPPSAVQMAIGIAAPVITTVLAWVERWEASQLAWFVLVVVLLWFAISRFSSREAARRPPRSFIWIPLSFLIGVTGTLLIAAAASAGPSMFWLHDLGRMLLLQGMFTGLIVGVGGLAIPLITRGEAPPDAGGGAREAPILALNLLAALVLLASFWIESRHSQPAGLLLRSGLVFVLLMSAARIWRPPSVPGLHRWLVWISAWMLPAGYFVAGLFPLQMKAGLHMVFIGGFALMAFAVSLHVSLAHGGFGDRLRGRPWQVPALGALCLTAMVLRVLADFDRARFFLWIGSSAGLFLLGTIAWGAIVLPCLVGGHRPTPGRPGS